MPNHAAPRYVRTRRALRGGSVALGAATAGLAVLASPAQAAQHDWSGVAQCESSGNWSANTGNGFYGGLQFTASTWNAYGGQQYASRADLASPAQQMAVAEKVLSGQGVGAWPVCGRHLSGGTTTVATRQAPAADPAPAAASQHSSGGTYTVRPGDTLTSVAAAHGTNWQTLYAQNSGAISNPNRIYVGQRLNV